MERSNYFWKVLNNIFPFTDFIYILQLEEYYSWNYFKRLPRFFFRRDFQKHDKIHWTFRAKITFGVSFLILLVFLSSAPAGLRMLFFVLSILLIPFWVGFASLLLNLPNLTLKYVIRKRAARFVLKQNPTAQIIAVVGSFGKTTTKNFIYQLIKYNYKVQMVEGNINTSIGIAQWILKNLDRTAEVILVEMDSYGRGEIKESCEILKPDISVLVSIGDQHISRFGNSKNLAKALLESIENSKSQALSLMSEGTQDEIKHLGLEKIFKNREVKLVTKNISYRQHEVSTNITSPANLNSLSLALKVSELLGVPDAFVIDTAKKLEIPDRRHKLIEREGYKVIDDTYNISLLTGEHGLSSARKMATYLNLKLVVITGGIPESGKDANSEYGRSLKKEADELIILENEFKKELVAELGNKKYLTADSLASGWEVIKNKFDPKDVLVLMQPELTDLHY